MIRMLTSDLMVPHGFFTRQGGVSTGAYDSLNCGMSGHDDPAHVSENRARAARAIGVDPTSLMGLKQVHGTHVIKVVAGWAAGDTPQADAMVTDRPGIALGIITADCAPVLFADSTNRIVGAAHAGWRGAAAGVLEATVTAMQALGAETIFAVIGPCIRRNSYEVGADLYHTIVSRESADVAFFDQTRENHWQFDLSGYAAKRLASIGVNTAIIPHDTYAEEDLFFSHRRRTRRAERGGGHQISIIRNAA
ncbi:peptidoglycan editing factor PgeF [Acidiphilium sp. PA]|uniref:peptidoglycan editing factor PgeF n=1 Tax=Acidiphilium sp. PA TaxID=2871705 RepID=UPI0022436F69|nr:peptidoglycan editing factor PgeF [Acidiphilium sp. PA]MCW8308339.1 peptidoglycan editing factor PgeF [Acidiphilium sp. PA]